MHNSDTQETHDATNRGAASVLQLINWVSGKVSYSNPVRQTLFDFADCQVSYLIPGCVTRSPQIPGCVTRSPQIPGLCNTLVQDGGANKAECAAAKLKQIFPLVEARGVTAICQS